MALVVARLLGPGRKPWFLMFAGLVAAGVGLAFALAVVSRAKTLEVTTVSLPPPAEE